MFRKKKPQGLTLAELLIAVFVLSIGILSALMFFTSAMLATETARDTMVATTHAEYTLEEMKTRSSLANITGTNWVSWASSSSINTLPSETVTVTFVNSSADPLDITVTVGWNKKGRSNNVSLRTEIHK